MKTPTIKTANGKVTGTIKKKMIAHMKKHSTITVDFTRWYVGISGNIEVRLKQHIKEKNIQGLYFEGWYVHSKINANNIESWFSKEKNTKNAPHAGGANEESKYVYCFKYETHAIDEILDLLRHLS